MLLRLLDRGAGGVLSEGGGTRRSRVAGESSVTEGWPGRLTVRYSQLPAVEPPVRSWVITRSTVFCRTMTRSRLVAIYVLALDMPAAGVVHIRYMAWALPTEARKARAAERIVLKKVLTSGTKLGISIADSVFGLGRRLLR